MGHLNKIQHFLEEENIIQNVYKVSPTISTMKKNIYQVRIVRIKLLIAKS